MIKGTHTLKRFYFIHNVEIPTQKRESTHTNVQSCPYNEKREFMYMYPPMYIFVNIVLCPHRPYDLLIFEYNTIYCVRPLAKEDVDSC